MINNNNWEEKYILLNRQDASTGFWIGLTMQEGSTTQGTYSDGTTFDCQMDYHDLQSCPLEVPAVDGQNCIVYGLFNYLWMTIHSIPFCLSVYSKDEDLKWFLCSINSNSFGNPPELYPSWKTTVCTPRPKFTCNHEG